MNVLRIAEPSTLITDLLLGALALACGIGLLRRSGWADRAARLWGAGLLTLGVAAIAGGLYHGFRPLLAPLAVTALWKSTVLAIGLADLLLLAGALFAWAGRRLRRLLLPLLVAKFAVYAVWMAGHDDFLYVLLEYGPSLLLLLVLALVAWRRRPDRGGAAITAGVLVSVLAALVQASGLSLHRHLNHNDLYHLVQMVAVWLFYRGARSWLPAGTAAATASDRQ